PLKRITVRSNRESVSYSLVKEAVFSVLGLSDTWQAQKPRMATAVTRAYRSSLSILFILMCGRPSIRPEKSRRSGVNGVVLFLGSGIVGHHEIGPHPGRHQQARGADPVIVALLYCGRTGLGSRLGIFALSS